MSSHKRFSRDGFQPLPHTRPEEMVANPHDVTIDIPLAPVTSRTGVRKTNTTTTMGNSTTTSPVTADQDSDHSHDHFDDKRQASRSLTNSRLAGRRRRLDDQARQNRDDADGTLTSAGRIYQRIYHFSVLTRYFLFVAPLALLIAVPMVIGATAAPNARIGGVKLLWFFTWLEVVWVSLWVSKLVAKLLPHVFQFLCGVVSPGTRKYAAVITNLEIPLSLVGWALTSLATFAVLMTQNPDARARQETSLKAWQTVVKNILFASLCSTLVLLAEKFLIQLISISYHRKQFDDKIRQSKRNIYLVSLLYDASRKLFPPYCPEFATDDYIVSDSLDLGATSRGGTPVGHKRSGSATPMKIIHEVGRVKDNVASVFGHVAQEVTGKKVFNPNAAHSVVVQALEKKHATEALARRIWLSLVLEGQDALYRDDICDVLGPDHQQEADEAFDTLDADANGDISLDELTMRLIEFGRDRLCVTHSVRDVDQAIHVLDSLLLAEVLGSCIFLFVKHPFDVGDRVDINSTQYTVERISLLFTMFKSVQNHKRTQVPNIVLNTLWIDNVSRSKAMRETVLIYVNFDTTLEDLDLLKREMARFVKDNPRDFQPGIDLELTDIAEMNKLVLKVEIKHKSNWANEAVRAARRNKFMCALVLALRQIPLYGPSAGGAPAGDKANPTYSVAISHSEAQTNAKQFDLDKAKKRIDYHEPTKDSSSSSSSTAVSTSVSFPRHSGADDRNGHDKDAHDKDVYGKDVHGKDVHKDTHHQPSLPSTHPNDIEEVRGVLRRETTTGRRRRAGTVEAHANTSLGPRTIPTIPDMSPAEPAQPSQRQPPRTSYFEDTSVLPARPPVPPPVNALLPDQTSSGLDLAPSDGNISSVSFPAPPTSAANPRDLTIDTTNLQDLAIHTTNPRGLAIDTTNLQDLVGRPLTRADSFTIVPSAQMQAMSPPTSTNPFYHKALPAHPPNEYPTGRERSLSERSLSPSQKRKPIPGMPEMKEFLTSPKSPTRI
ncbi:hypothetical protein DV737_g3433, partial [Chaetothyriales sp. CBS 132003]